MPPEPSLLLCSGIFKYEIYYLSTFTGGDYKKKTGVRGTTPELALAFHTDKREHTYIHARSTCTRNVLIYMKAN